VAEFGSSADPPERERRVQTPRHLAEKALGAGAELEGERNPVTVMFVEIVRSMDLERELGSERWRKVLDGFFRIAAHAVHRFEGTVDKFTGDGIMAIFG